MRRECAVEGDVRLEDWMWISRKRRLGVDAAGRSGVAVVMRGVSGRIVDAVERRMWLTDGMWTLRKKK